jgi:cytochrome d ubiquinol oxidase subunit I
LKSVPPADRPPLVAPFFAFRIMVGIGLLMIAAGFVGVFLWWRGRLFSTRWYLLLAAQAWWIGFVALICGWIVTEVGRQPWLVYHVLRTADATSPVPAHNVAASLVLYIVVYVIIFAFGLYYMNRLIVRGPAPAPAGEPPTSPLVANRPLTAASDAPPAAQRPGSSSRR